MRQILQPLVDKCRALRNRELQVSIAKQRIVALERELAEERARLDWVFSLEGASLEEIDAILAHTNTPDEARASIDVARKGK